MSTIHKHPIYLVFRVQARQLKTLTHVTLSQAQEALALAYGFVSFHNIQNCIQKAPDDIRLDFIDIWPGKVILNWNWGHEYLDVIERLNQAYQSYGEQEHSAHDVMAMLHGFSTHLSLLETVETADTVFSNVHGEVDMELGDVLSGEIAETNAYAFTIDDYELIQVIQDRNEPDVLRLEANISYVGEQDPDKMFHGSKFDVNAEITLSREGPIEPWGLEDIIISSAKNETSDPSYYL